MRQKERSINHPLKYGNVHSQYRLRKPPCVQCSIENKDQFERCLASIKVFCSNDCHEIEEKSTLGSKLYLKEQQKNKTILRKAGSKKTGKGGVKPRQQLSTDS